MRKCCDLCGGGQASVHCESDQASLCWACDLKVHAANFLVEKHVRALLCGSCSAHTPWKASGACLGSAATVCEVCFRHREFGVGVLCGEEGRVGVDRDARDEGLDDEEVGEDDVEDEDADELDDEEDGENQVVPWAFDSPPPVDISSSTGEMGDDFGDVCESRMDEMHRIVHPDLAEQELCHSYASSAQNAWVAASSDPSLYRPAKRQRRIDEPMRNGQHLCSDGQEEGPSLAKLLHAFPTAATISRPG